MAGKTVDNADLTDYTPHTITLSDGTEVQVIHLATAVEGGAKTDLAKAEDAPHVAGDRGFQLLAVRKDAGAQGLADADGDYHPLEVDASGRLYVSLPNSPLGTTDDAIVTGDVLGTVSAKLRGLNAWAYVRMPASLGQKAMAASLPVVFASDQSAISVGPRVRTTDSISAAPQRAVVMDSLTARTVTVVNMAVAASQTDSVLVAAQGAGVKIAVRWFLISNQNAASATSAQFNSKPAGAGTKLQSFQVPASDVRGAGSNDDGWIVTAANEGLTLTTGGQGVDISFAWFPTT